MQAINKNPISWISSSIKKLWAEQPKKQLVPSENLENSPKQMKKNHLLTKLRGCNSQKNFQNKLKKVNNFFNHSNVTQTNARQKLLEFQCPICMDYLIHPITTVCGHTFCHECLDESLLTISSCPVCRQGIRGTNFYFCQSLNSLILRWILNKKNNNAGYKSQEELQKSEQNYLKNVQRYEQWRQRRSIQVEKLAVGQLIDVRDTEHIWCKAQIKKIFYKKINNELEVQNILIHYLGWSYIYDQIIEPHSQRITKLGFYTSRNYIPRYHIVDENEHHLHSYVVIGSPELYHHPIHQELPIIQQQEIQGEQVQQLQQTELPQINPVHESSSESLGFEFEVQDSGIFAFFDNNNPETPEMLLEFPLHETSIGTKIQFKQMKEQELQSSEINDDGLKLESNEQDLENQINEFYEY